MPVVEITPIVVASPNACVSRSNSPMVRPGSARTVRAGRIDANALHGREIDHQPVIADRLACDAVTAATHRHWKTVLTGEADAGDHVGRAGASRDERGTPIDDPVEDDARRIVTRLAGSE